MEQLEPVFRIRNRYWTQIQAEIKKKLDFSFNFLAQFLTPDSHDGTTFPKLTLCAISIHSKQKLHEKYPKLTPTMLKRFYGTASTSKEKALWENNAAMKVSVLP